MQRDVEQESTKKTMGENLYDSHGNHTKTEGNQTLQTKETMSGTRLIP